MNYQARIAVNLLIYFACFISAHAIASDFPPTQIVSTPTQIVSTPTQIVSTPTINHGQNDHNINSPAKGKRAQPETCAKAEIKRQRFLEGCTSQFNEINEDNLEKIKKALKGLKNSLKNQSVTYLEARKPLLLKAVEYIFMHIVADVIVNKLALPHNIFTHLTGDKKDLQNLCLNISYEGCQLSDDWLILTEGENTASQHITPLFKFKHAYRLKIGSECEIKKVCVDKPEELLAACENFLSEVQDSCAFLYEVIYERVSHYAGLHLEM